MYPYLSPMPNNGPFGLARLTRVTVLLLVVIVLFLRLGSLSSNEFSWDVFGYYLYLPATFIHHDPLLRDTAWIHELIRARPEISGTLYQLSTAPDNSTPIFFFLMGAALCYLPFFLIGHVAALLGAGPVDGFSAPYQIAVAVGCLFYAWLGLVHLRRILLRFFSEGVSAATLVVIVVGTNYLHFATMKNLETANFLFCWMSVLVWNTLRWHEEGKRTNLLWTAFSIALITLIKPSEIFCGLIPMLWGVHDGPSLRAKLDLMGAHGKDLLVAALVGLLVLSPQLLYWKTMTGSFVYDSYKNPGVGLDLLRPHILHVLFSFRKGWLVYTPVMLFAIAGLVPLYRKRREVFWSVVVYCSVAFYILASWSEWWYGASYSIRPMITLYPLLALPLGHAFSVIAERKGVMRFAGASLVALLVMFNCFQLWQFDHWILHPYRTTTAYYWAVFGRTSVPEGAANLLSFERSFDGSDRMGDVSRYDRRMIGSYTFEDSANTGALVMMDTLAQGRVAQLDSMHPYSPNFEFPYDSVTDKDHCWAKASVRIFIPKGYAGDPPCLVFSMERKEGSYGYRTFCDSTSASVQGRWTSFGAEYLTPPIRDVRDRLKVYLWQRGIDPVRIDDLQLEVFSPR